MTTFTKVRNAFRLMVSKKKKPGEDIRREMTAEEADLLHMTIGIVGEAGELLDAVKKNVIYRDPLDIDNVREELGDIEFYLEGLRQNLGIIREQTLKENIEKLDKRYAEAYSDEEARNRADKSQEERNE